VCTAVGLIDPKIRLHWSTRRPTRKFLTTYRGLERSRMPLTKFIPALPERGPNWSTNLGFGVNMWHAYSRLRIDILSDSRLLTTFTTKYFTAIMNSMIAETSKSRYAMTIEFDTKVARKCHQDINPPCHLWLGSYYLRSTTYYISNTWQVRVSLDTKGKE
jgi:hypothetical protein